MTECILIFPIAIIALIFIIIKLISLQRIFSSREYYKQFKHIEEIGSFEEVKPLFHYNGKREKSVLLIHGFSASSSEFRFLTAELKKHDISFYAPTLTGFGLDDYHLLYKIKYADWLRDAVNAYDLMKSLTDDVIVIGHSMGGLLAFHLSYLRPLNKVIMTNPYLTVKNEHKISKIILLNGFIWSVIRALNPILSKERKSKNQQEQQTNTTKRFAIPIFPLSIVRELWVMLDRLNYKRISIKDIHIYFGNADTTVVPQMVKQHLKNNNVGFAYTEFKNSGHNILEDKENTEVIESIINRIN